MFRSYSRFLTTTLLFAFLAPFGGAKYHFLQNIILPLASTEVSQIENTTLSFWRMNQIADENALITQKDVDDDGLPDITFIDSTFYTENDQIIVVDGSQNMVWGDDPYLVTDFTDDIWIFDVNADGTAQLIIDFNVEGNQYTALIYDDLDGDSQVHYRLVQDQLTVEESKFWHIKVVSDKDWNQPDDFL